MTARNTGKNTTPIATNPPPQQYCLNRTARPTRMRAPRQIAQSTVCSPPAAYRDNIDAISRTGIEAHLMLLVTIANIVFPLAAEHLLLTWQQPGPLT